MRADVLSRAYALGEDEGYESACREAGPGFAHDDFREEAGEKLVYALGPYSAGKFLGVQLYSRGALTPEGEQALLDYGAGAEEGWNRRVDELDEARYGRRSR